MRLFRIISVLFPLAVLFSCQRDSTQAYEVEGETCSLTVKINTESVSTKAAGTLKDGYSFRNLLLILADNANKKVASSYTDYSASPAETAEVNFDHLRVGSYHLYAYANIDHTAWQDAQSIEAVEKALAEGGNLNPNRLMKVLESGSAPSAPAEAMLLTGDSELSLGSLHNEVGLELLRPVSRLNVYLHNHTDYSIRLNTLRFSHFNPSHAYLLSHWNEEGTPVLPESNVYGQLPAFSGPVTLGGGNAENLVYSTLLYENNYPDGYRMYANMTLDPDGTHTQDKDLRQMAPHLLTGADISEMQVGDVKQVLFVNPCSASEAGGILYLDGSNVKRRTAYYSSEATYRALVESILADVDNKDKYIFSLNRLENDSKTGLPLFTLVAGTKNVFKGSNKEGAYLETVTPSTSSQYPVSSDFNGYLFRVRTDAWGNLDYLRSKSGNIGYNDVENSSDAKSYTGGDYGMAGLFMWAMYEISVKGSELRLIDNRTSQVAPLKYMRRNQELNVVMNVYYKELNRSFEFEVDNAYWTTGHRSSHVFE